MSLKKFIQSTQITSEDCKSTLGELGIPTLLPVCGVGVWELQLCKIGSHKRCMYRLDPPHVNGNRVKGNRCKSDRQIKWTESSERLFLVSLWLKTLFVYLLHFLSRMSQRKIVDYPPFIQDCLRHSEKRIIIV